MKGLLAQALPMPVGLSIMLLADGATTVDPNILSIVGNGVTIVVLAWYVIYDVRVRTPAMMAVFSKEQSELREAFALDQQSTRESYRAIIEGVRTTFAAEQAATRQAFVSEQSAVRAQYDREMAEVRTMLFENLKAMRQAVHDVRDTAQGLMGKDK